MSLEFKKIEVNSIQEMLPFYAMRHNMTCDSVFLESYVWKDYYNVRYAIWENKALLWLMENEGRCFSAMPLCREEDLPGAFAAIEEYFNEELGYPLVINLADEYAVKYLNLPEDKYLVEEQVDSRDYLYNGDAMRSLAGKKLHKKKNRVNAFKREYEGRYEYRRLCCSDSHDVWVFLDRWRQQKGEEVEEHLDYEVKGIHDILKNCSEFSIHMGGVYIDGQMEAFTIGSYNPVEHMAVIHIEKANPEINGLYQFINQQFLIEEFPEAEWVNREDDMGLEGLRKAKMTYYPADYARKYLVEQLLNGSKGEWPNNGDDIDDSLTVTLGGSYDFDVVKIYLGAQYFDEVRLSSLGGPICRANDVRDLGISGFDLSINDIAKLKGYGISLSGDAPLAGGRVMFGLGYVDADAADSLDKALSQNIAGFRDFEIQRYVVSAGYSYPFSKRTDVYGVASYMQDNEDTSRESGTLEQDPSAYSFYVGLRHKF